MPCESSRKRQTSDLLFTRRRTEAAERGAVTSSAIPPVYIRCWLEVDIAFWWPKRERRATGAS